MISVENEYTVAPGARFGVSWRYSAMVFDVDGTLRYIAASSVVCMDQLEAAPEKAEKKSDAGSVFYG